MNYVGLSGEQIAKQVLIRLGWKFLSKNVRFGHIELDLVFTDKTGRLRFVECKTTNWSSAIECGENIGQAKLRRLKKAINLYLLFNQQILTDWSLDIALIVYNPSNKPDITFKTLLTCQGIPP